MYLKNLSPQLVLRFKENPYEYLHNLEHQCQIVSLINFLLKYFSEPAEDLETDPHDNLIIE